MTGPVQSKDDVIARLREVKQELASLGVTGIRLFGSFLKGQQTDASDVDLLLEFDPAAHTFDNFMEAAFLLEDLFGRRVDAVTPEALSPFIGPHILAEAERVSLAA